MPKTTSLVQAVEQDVHTISDVPRANLGDKAITADGRVYRYAKAAGTALAPGKLCVAATPVANHENITVAAAVAVGETTVTATLGATAATAGDYDGGYMVVNDADGEGIAYQIKHSSAADSGGVITIELEDTVRVALTTSSQVSLQKNLYKDVVISAADQADCAVGVPNVDVTANYYFWLQTGGTCSVLADEAITQGLAVTIGSSVVGAVEGLDGAGEQQVGIAITAGVDTEYRAVRLTLDN